MKKLILILSVVAILLGCKKETSAPSPDKQVLVGQWVNTQLDTDTLFWNDNNPFGL